MDHHATNFNLVALVQKRIPNSKRRFRRNAVDIYSQQPKMMIVSVNGDTGKFNNVPVEGDQSEVDSVGLQMLVETRQALSDELCRPTLSKRTREGQ